MKLFRSRRALLTLGAAVLTLPLIAGSASAGVGDGFFVHAQDTKSPEFQATAGKGKNPGKGPGNNNGNGNGGGEVVTPPVATIASLSCGPLTLGITQEMADFSAANEALLEAGRESEMTTHPDGWKIIISGSNAGDMAPGLPEDGSNPPGVLILGEPGFLEDFSPWPRAMVMKMDDSVCQSFDYTAPKEAGVIHTFESNIGNAYPYREGRYAMVDGELASAFVDGSSLTDFEIRYRANTDDPRFEDDEIASATVPHFYSVGAEGRRSARINLPSEVAGYSGFLMDSLGDGSGNTEYLSGTTGRTDGPKSVSWNAEGQVDGVVTPSNTTLIAGPGGWTLGNVAELRALYQDRTGVNWDGTYLTIDDFDTSLPFQPTFGG